MQYNGPQVFRESVRISGANGTVDVPLAELNAAGTALTFNSTGVPATCPGLKKPVTAGTAGVTLVAADSGRVLISTKTSATQTFVLPAASNAGATFHFVCTSAASEMLVNVATGDNVQLKASEGGASVVTAASSGCKNTAATNVVGDSITLVADGTTTWIAIQQSGIWATQ